MKRREFLGALGAGLAMGEAQGLAQRGRPLAPGEVRAPREAAPPAM